MKVIMIDKEHNLHIIIDKSILVVEAIVFIPVKQTTILEQTVPQKALGRKG